MVILYRDHLLPANETPFNKASSAVDARLDEYDAPTRAVWDPWTCPVEFLPFLAHALSVDLWREAWPEVLKRRIISESVEMQGQKGTLAAVYKYLRYTDARLISLTRSPQKQYMGARLGKAEREEWLKRLPQVRVFFHRERSNEGARLFSGIVGSKYSNFFYKSCTTPPTAHTRLERRAKYVVNEQETDVRVSNFGSTYMLHLRGPKGGITVDGDFMGGPGLKTYVGLNTAPTRLVIIEPKSGRPYRAAVYPSVTAVQHEPELIKIRRPKPHNVFSGRDQLDGFGFCGPQGGEFFIPSDAHLSLFERHAIHDGSTYSRPPAEFFLNDGRFGFPSGTVRYRIAAPRNIPVVAAGEGFAIPGESFWLPRDQERMDFAMRALTASKRASDYVKVETNWRPQVIAGRDILRAGIDSYIIGRPKPEVIYGTES